MRSAGVKPNEEATDGAARAPRTLALPCEVTQQTSSSQPPPGCTSVRKRRVVTLFSDWTVNGQFDVPQQEALFHQLQRAKEKLQTIE